MPDVATDLPLVCKLYVELRHDQVKSSTLSMGYSIPEV